MSNPSAEDKSIEELLREKAELEAKVKRKRLNIVRIE